MSQVNLKFESQVAGLYKLEAVKRNGARRVLADWFPNLITNGGLDQMGTASNWLNWCQVGSGSGAPNENDSALGNRIAGTSTTQSNTLANQSSQPYYVSRTKVFRFSEGAAAGNLSEVGVGWSEFGSLFSRALILDSSGSPTTVTVLADESLDVTYQFRFYPPVSDINGSVQIGGSLRDFVSRASNVTSQTATIGWSLGASGTSQESPTSGNSITHRVYDGQIEGMESSPSGASSNRSSVSNVSYSIGSYDRTATATWGLADGNFANGISALFFKFGIGAYQMSIDPPIMKTSNDVLSLTVTHSWARKTL